MGADKRMPAVFLDIFNTIKGILSYVINYAENHSEVLGVVVALVGSAFWLRKYMRQKRAEAFFGFYTKLSLCIKELSAQLSQDDLLEYKDPEKGNFFSLMYTNEKLQEFCPSFHKPEQQRLDLYKDDAEAIKTLLHDTEQNVYPKGCDRNKWYNSLYTIYAACEFLLDNRNWALTNESKNKNGQIKHVARCKEYLDAVAYIQAEINKTAY